MKHEVFFMAVNRDGNPKLASDGHIALYHDKDSARRSCGMGFTKLRVEEVKLKRAKRETPK